MLFDMTSRKPAESAGKPAGCSPSGGVAAALLSEREEWQAWAARAVQNESPPPRGERGAPRRRVAPTSRSSMRRARRCPLWGGRSLSSPWRGVPSGATWPVSLARPSESVTLTIPKGTAHPVWSGSQAREPPVRGQTPLFSGHLLVSSLVVGRGGGRPALPVRRMPCASQGDESGFSSDAPLRASAAVCGALLRAAALLPLAALGPCGGLSSWLGFWLPARPLDPGTRTRGARVAPAGAAGGRRQAGRAHSRSCRSCREDPEPSPMLPRHLPLLARAPTPPRAHGDSGGAFCLFAAPSLRSCGSKGDSGRLFPAARVLGR